MTDAKLNCRKGITAERAGNGMAGQVNLVDGGSVDAKVWMATKDEFIEEGTEVVVAFIKGEWQIILAACEA